MLSSDFDLLRYLLLGLLLDRVKYIISGKDLVGNFVILTISIFR